MVVGVWRAVEKVQLERKKDGWEESGRWKGRQSARKAAMAFTKRYARVPRSRENESVLVAWILASSASGNGKCAASGFVNLMSDPHTQQTQTQTQTLAQAQAQAQTPQASPAAAREELPNDSSLTLGQLKKIVKQLPSKQKVWPVPCKSLLHSSLMQCIC